MDNVGTIYAHLEYITDIWSVLGQFGTNVVIWYIFHVLVHCKKKNLATLQEFAARPIQLRHFIDCVLARRLGEPVL
jgi:hypothetical protein